MIEYGCAHNDVFAIVMKGKATIVVQTPIDLFQKGKDGVGHFVNGSQFDGNPGIVIVGKVEFEFDSEWSVAVSRLERMRGDCIALDCIGWVSVCM